MPLVLRETRIPCYDGRSNENVFVNNKEHILRVMHILYVLCGNYSTLSDTDVTQNVAEVADKLFQYFDLAAPWDEREFMTSYMRQAIVDIHKDTGWVVNGRNTGSDYKQYINICRRTIKIIKFVQDVIGRGISLSSLQWFLSNYTQEAVKLTPECSACIYTCKIINDTAYITKVWLCDTCVDRMQMLRLTADTRECTHPPGLEGGMRFAFNNFLSCAKTELVYSLTSDQSLLIDNMFAYYVQHELLVTEDGRTPVCNDMCMLDTSDPTISFMVLLKSQSDRPTSILFMYTMYKWHESLENNSEFDSNHSGMEAPSGSTVIGLIIVAVSREVDADQWRGTAINMGVDPHCIIIPSSVHHLLSLIETATQNGVCMLYPIFIILRYDQITRSIAASFSQYTFLGIVISEPEVGRLNNIHYLNLLSLLSLNPLHVRSQHPSHHTSSPTLSGYTRPLQYEYQRITLRSPLSLPPAPTMYHTASNKSGI
jgi:hypothetical protein